MTPPSEVGDVCEESSESSGEDGKIAVRQLERPGELPNTPRSAAQYAYEVAGALESKRGNDSTASSGIQQLLVVAEQILDGTVQIPLAVQLASVWLDPPMWHGGEPACGNATSAIRRLTQIPTEAPDVIWVFSPTKCSHCSGRYIRSETDQEFANGYPIWEKTEGLHRYMYSTKTGKWRITDDRADFAHGGGFMMSTPHNGEWPHTTVRWGLKGEEDLDIEVTAQETNVLPALFEDIDGDHIDMFALRRKEGGLQYAVNGVPRPSAHCLSFDTAGMSLVFPKLGLELELNDQPRSLLSVLRDVSIVATASRVSFQLPSASRLWLSCWKVVQNSTGRPYFYHCKTRQTTFDLCLELSKVLESC